MPRKIKCRRICAEPQNKLFTPESSDADFITLNVDQLEAVRLCDLEGLDQDLAAEKMNISRGTFQRVIYSARKSIAQALCNGMGIIISGGNYEIIKSICTCNNKCNKCIFKNKEGDLKDE